ncbi:sensor histidine kinase [Nocardioides halotolerans]|uniref:sensor histidine kinase n=1 Tax=Nocardioides halotolerans TaxID=433660 RepID=UPI000402B5A3|nr:histidine kinase [Nocardioides halotolerans]
MTPTDEQVARLRVLILVDCATAFTAAVLMFVSWILWVDSPVLPVVTVAVAVAGAVMARALWPLRRGDVPQAVLWWAAANWGIAIVAAAIATFAWPLMMLAALLPAVLATATATGRALTWYVIGSVAVCTAVVALGVLQDVSGLTEKTPLGLQHWLLALFIPAMAAMVGLIVLQNSLRLQGALAGALEAQRELADQAEELRRSRARVVAATDRERRRIERDLHDGAQQGLISIGIGLAGVTSLCRTDPDAAVAALTDLRRQLHLAHDEVRNLAQGVYPPVLSEHGLVEALRSAVDRYALPVTLDLHDPGRHPSELEAAVYFCCIEALQNAAKHSGASRVRVSLGADEDSMWFTVADDGIGFDPDAPGSGGMVNMQDRLGASGGTLRVESSPGGGTTVHGSVPTSPPAQRPTARPLARPVVRRAAGPAPADLTPR